MSRDLAHGGALDAMRAAYPDARTPWIDLSTGINPWPYPDLETSADALTRLPTQTMYDACRNAMAGAMGASADTLRLAPGSELLIRLLPDIIRPKSVAILSPTYGDHEAAWGRSGAEIIKTDTPLNLAPSVDAIVITQPNNPDGRFFAPNVVDAARQTLAVRGGWLIVDEAYADLIPASSMAEQGGARGLIVLRSFGKVFGLAGVRLGGIFAPAELRPAIEQRLGAWPISGTALEIGARAYSDHTWQAQTRKKFAEAAGRLDALLVDAGLAIVGGTDLFRYVHAKDAHATFEQLAQGGIYVRRFEWSATALRIGLPANKEAEARLRAALTL